MSPRLEGTGSVVGKPAPDFCLKNEDGKPIRLYEELQKGPTIVVFYPGDFTHVCTRQLCNYAESWDEFVKLGVNILGISGNDTTEHANFKQVYSLPFSLLSDPGKQVARLFGCTSPLMFGAVSRAIAIINRKGIILYRYVEPTILTRRKANELIGILRDLNQHGLL